MARLSRCATCGEWCDSTHNEKTPHGMCRGCEETKPTRNAFIISHDHPQLTRTGRPRRCHGSGTVPVGVYDAD